MNPPSPLTITYFFLEQKKILLMQGCQRPFKTEMRDRIWKGYRKRGEVKDLKKSRWRGKEWGRTLINSTKLQAMDKAAPDRSTRRMSFLEPKRFQRPHKPLAGFVATKVKKSEFFLEPNRRARKNYILTNLWKYHKHMKTILRNVLLISLILNPSKLKQKCLHNRSRSV